MTRAEFDALLASLIERDGALLFRDQAGPSRKGDEDVDLYVFSGHLEALRSEEIDGEIEEHLMDLGYPPAASEEAAWEQVRDFYLERGCVLLRVEADEYVLSEQLAQHLKLL
ncbi:hypothetical protein HNR42_003516 [Deinobacterium chartae]|uniref:Uncharacterized protein n=1 Tax=Deinobacterium chartae TaxID=521158 RepID=A0A841I2K9_9DEIO|nr:hypothetical protein [Deinobacterium chartae]MBB6100051.1 hypothetical protein [Deinobacterium chartae]